MCWAGLVDCFAAARSTSNELGWADGLLGCYWMSEMGRFELACCLADGLSCLAADNLLPAGLHWADGLLGCYHIKSYQMG